MNLNFKPMLACSTIPELDKINYPVIASPKLDGIRCIMADGIAFSRTMKRIPNIFIRETLAKLRLHGLDGELMVDGDFEKVSSVIMSHVHIDQVFFYYNVFDYFHDGSAPFKVRKNIALNIVQELNDPRIRYVEQQWLICKEDLDAYYGMRLIDGYEGVIVRDPESPYKQGRSTLKQGWLLKLKPFEDSEATIVGFEELMHNDDTSTNKVENQVPGGVLGALRMLNEEGISFKIGSGFNTAQRDEIWQRIDYYLGKKVVYKHQGVTKYGVPRFPTYKGIRHEDDI